MIEGDARHNRLEMAAEAAAWEAEHAKLSDGDRMLVYRDSAYSDEEVLVAESKRYGIEIDGKPIGLWALLRHLYNNRDAIVGTNGYTIDLLQKRADLYEEALRRIKPLTDPDSEPFDTDTTKQLLAMRDRASEAWVLAATALAEEPLPPPREKL